VYNKRSWTLQFVLYFVGLITTTLSVLTGDYKALQDMYELRITMLMLPVASALIATVSTRLRQHQKYSICKMASYEIVSEIYKFRVKALE
jgi:hypothetical protein